jgi:hypothetical protein
MKLEGRGKYLGIYTRIHNDKFIGDYDSVELWEAKNGDYISSEGVKFVTGKKRLVTFTRNYGFETHSVIPAHHVK